MTPTDPRDMGDHQAHDDHAAHDEPCSCSEANAQELHELVAALAEHRGFSVCHLDSLGDDADDPDDDAEMHDLQIIHDLLVAQGAHCTGIDGDDDEADESGEFEVSKFADDAEFDGDDDGAADDPEDFDLDVIDLDDDDEASEFADATPATFADDAVTTPPVEFT